MTKLTYCTGSKITSFLTIGMTGYFVPLHVAMIALLKSSFNLMSSGVRTPQSGNSIHLALTPDPDLDAA